MDQPAPNWEDRPEYWLLPKSKWHVFLAWLFAGPFTPVLWLWLLTDTSDPFSELPFKLLTSSVPATIGVSLAWIFYARYRIKSGSNVFVASLGAFFLTPVVMLAGWTVLAVTGEPSADLYGLIAFAGQIFLVASVILGIPLAFLTYFIVRMIALRRGQPSDRIVQGA